MSERERERERDERERERRKGEVGASVTRTERKKEKSVLKTEVSVLKPVGGARNANTTFTLSVPRLRTQKRPL